MHLLLGYSFNHFEIIQGSSVGYREYGLFFLLFFDDQIIFKFLVIFLNNSKIYGKC